MCFQCRYNWIFGRIHSQASKILLQQQMPQRWLLSKGYKPNKNSICCSCHNHFKLITVQHSFTHGLRNQKMNKSIAKGFLYWCSTDSINCKKYYGIYYTGWQKKIGNIKDITYVLCNKHYNIETFAKVYQIISMIYKVVLINLLVNGHIGQLSSFYEKFIKLYSFWKSSLKMRLFSNIYPC